MQTTRKQIVASLCLALAAAAACPALAADNRGEAVNERLDRRGEAINERLDRRAERAEAAGKTGLAERLDVRGDRIENRLDRKGNRIENRLDRRGNRIERRAERRHARRHAAHTAEAPARMRPPRPAGARRRDAAPVHQS